MKTVRVRICVSGAPDGAWSAVGYSNQSDAESRADAIEFNPTKHDSDGSDFRISWIEADVPMPEPQPETTIEGKVSQ